LTERQSTYIGLAWDRNREPDLAGYRVQVNGTGAGAEGPFRVLSGLLLSTSFRAEGLEMNTTYHFAVDAVDRAAPVPNNSTLSAAVSATTKLLVPNRAPGVLLPLPKLSLEEDSKTPVILPYSSVFSDPDGDPLYFSYRPSAGLRVTETANGSGLEILPLPDWNGPAEISLSANDSLLETSANVAVTVTPKNDLPFFVGVEPLWTFTEHFAGKFEFWAEDRADNDTILIVATDLPDLIAGIRPGQNFWLNTSVAGEGSLLCKLTLVPENSMVGTYQCRLNVSDSAGGFASASVQVRIININDPPSAGILGPADGQIFENNATINLSGAAFDDDLLHGDSLTFEWRADGSVVLGRTQNVSGVILQPGNHTITLTVKDASGLSDRAGVNITVREKTVPPPPAPPPKRPSVATPAGLPVMALAAVAIAALVVAALAVLFLRRKK
jgi:hypothetical protein